MKTKGWVVAALVAGGLLVRAQGGCLQQSAAPDERLATHLEEMCAIARDHVNAPEKGVKKLGRYLGANLGSITGSFGSTIATIERVADDKAHDDRARLARDRIHKPLVACERHWILFADAVQRDPKAKAIVERAGERLNRTFDILLGKRQNLSLRDLPSRVDDAFGNAFGNAFGHDLGRPLLVPLTPTSP